MAEWWQRVSLRLEALALGLLDEFSPRRKALRALRARWGRPGDGDGWLTSRYFELRRPAETQCVDERTWTDLELPKLFAALDTAVTPVGRQHLYRRLRTYIDDPDEAAERYRLYETLRTDQALRERVQLVLHALQADSAAWIADFIFAEAPRPSRYGALLVAWSSISIAILGGVVALSWPPGLVLLLLTVNAGVLFVVRPGWYRQAEAFAACSTLIETAGALARIDAAAHVPELDALRTGNERLARLKRTFHGYALSARWHSLPLAESVAFWLNLLCLPGLVAHNRTVGRFLAVRADLAWVFDLLGALDAAIAVASFQQRLPRHCRPELADQPLIEILDGCHPLIDDPTPNSVRLDARSALVTGSNMAGKTTFIKMVGLNAVIGRTLGLCMASRATLPRSRVMASIRGEHSVESGKSHYFAQVEALREFIEIAERGEHALFLIDELFSGTNTVERIAAAKAVLDALAAQAQVLVTTHDVELQTLLGPRFELLHFNEDPDVDGFFDYRLRSGPSTERNALRLLERLGMPEHIVHEALDVAAMLEDTAPAEVATTIGPTGVGGGRPSRVQSNRARSSSS